MIWRISLVVASGLVLWLAGAWAFAFWMIIQGGYVKFVEPNRLILYAEFYLAVFLTVTALIAIIVIAKKGGRGQ